jgi:hypothetical protein
MPKTSSNSQGWDVLLFSHWDVPNVCLFVVVALLISVAIRALTSAMRAWELYERAGRREAYGRLFFCGLVGKFPQEFAQNTGRAENQAADIWTGQSDFLYPFILGLMELLCYPILMRAGAWTVVGAWLAFKTVVHWSSWAKNRNPFNRYLIGNALVVVASFAMALMGLVTLKPH